MNVTFALRCTAPRCLKLISNIVFVEKFKLVFLLLNDKNWLKFLVYRKNGSHFIFSHYLLICISFDKAGKYLMSSLAKSWKILPHGLFRILFENSKLTNILYCLKSWYINHSKRNIHALPAFSYFVCFVFVFAVFSYLFYINIREKVYFRSQILECPSIGEYWNISNVPVLPENVIFTFFRMCWCYSEAYNTGTQKRSSIVQYSCTSIWTWSILFPRLGLLAAKSLEKCSNPFLIENTLVLFPHKWSIDLSEFTEYSESYPRPLMSLM